MTVFLKTAASILLFSFAATTSQAFATCEMGDTSLKKGLYGHALSYYEMCVSEKPDSEDYYKLGNLYYKGLGLTAPDYSSASEFFGKAAKRGHAPSMLFLGLMAARGNGLEAPDNIEGYKWFLLAAERPSNKWIYGFDTNDTPKALAYLKQIASAMTDEEKQEATVRAGLFKEEIIMEQAEKFLTPNGLIAFKNAYAKGDENRRKALEKLKTAMESAPQGNEE